MVRLDVLRSCLRYFKAVIQPRKEEMYKNFISSLIRYFRALALVNLAAVEKNHCLDTQGVLPVQVFVIYPKG